MVSSQTALIIWLLTNPLYSELKIYDETFTSTTVIDCNIANPCTDDEIYYAGTHLQLSCSYATHCDGLKVYCGTFDPPGDTYGVTEMDGTSVTCDIIVSTPQGNIYFHCKGSNVNKCTFQHGVSAVSLSTLECDVNPTATCEYFCVVACGENDLQCHTGSGCSCRAASNFCSNINSITPTSAPTNDPTSSQTYNPTNDPTQSPTTNNPTTLESTHSPTTNPTLSPIFNPTTNTPTTSYPTPAPTTNPTFNPSISSTNNHTTNPTYPVDGEWVNAFSTTQSVNMNMNGPQEDNMIYIYIAISSIIFIAMIIFLFWRQRKRIILQNKTIEMTANSDMERVVSLNAEKVSNVELDQTDENSKNKESIVGEGDQVYGDNDSDELYEGMNVQTVKGINDDSGPDEEMYDVVETKGDDICTDDGNDTLQIKEDHVATTKGTKDDV